MIAAKDDCFRDKLSGGSKEAQRRKLFHDFSFLSDCTFPYKTWRSSNVCLNASACSLHIFLSPGKEGQASSVQFINSGRFHASGKDFARLVLVARLHILQWRIREPVLKFLGPVVSV